MPERRWRWSLLFTLLAVALTGCVQGPAPAPPSTSPTTVPRSFTVGTTDRITVTDPAGIVDAASAVVAYNVFQRLMTTDPAEAQAPKPDAARDCRFASSTRFICTLQEGLKFHNGHDLTSSDVKFSIERALRLNIDGSSVSALASLRRIETPDDVTVEFVLSRPDTQFSWGLATPAASIVDEELYDPDTLRPAGASMVGSGPFQVSFYSSEELQLAPTPVYKGRFPAQINGLVVRVFADSAALETAMQQHEVDVVWRGLSTPAIARLSNQISQNQNNRTDLGYSQVILPGARVRELWWNPASPHRKDDQMRKAVAAALQEYRVLTSLVPPKTFGHVASFDVGAGAKPQVPGKKRVHLTLAYDPTAPDAADQANQIRARLEETGGLSVRLVHATPVESADADLRLVDFTPWTPTPMAWLQPYLDHPVDTSGADKAARTVRENGDPAKVAPALAKLQQLAAKDLVALPIIQTDESIFVAEGWAATPERFAPNWQLGLWGFARA